MKKNFKIIISFFLGVLFSFTSLVVAQTIIKSNEVTYDNSKSKGSFSNVQGSLDELYSKAGYTGEEYHEEILHGADPVLSGELIPVYLSDNGDVYYANTHTKWYEYATKRWANAIILVDDAYAKNREDNKDKYSVGDKISEEDIESYFVWIPRYAYKLWNIDSQDGIIDAGTLNNEDYASSPSNLNNTRIIDIEFGTKTYLDEKGYKSLIRKAETGEFKEPEGLDIGNYLEHAAFTLGDYELNGFWIGKFETGYNQTNSGESAITGTSLWTVASAEVGRALSNKIIVKPNVNSWRSIKIADAFNSSKEYKTDLRSHILKNTEWGAVAYLSHSVFGKEGEININNNSEYKTGYSASPSINQLSCTGTHEPLTNVLNEKYNTLVGYLASTTGNITGVYDMVGGAWEYVAASIMNHKTDDGSGFTSEIIASEMKLGYIDAYPSDSDVSTFNKRILGDATGELVPFYSYYAMNGYKSSVSSWYTDISEFVDANNPWFYRGGGFSDGCIAGIFFFTRRTGTAANTRGFRLALAP